MPFSPFPRLMNPFENTAAAIERHLRMRRLREDDEAEPEFPEAEIDDSERRAAMVRERMRRLGIR